MPAFAIVSGLVALSPGIIPVIAVTTAGLDVMSIVPVVNAHVELAESVNSASDTDPAPNVSAARAVSSAAMPRRRVRRRLVRS